MRKISVIMAAMIAMASICTSSIAAETTIKNTIEESTKMDIDTATGQELVFKTIRPKKPDLGANF